MLNDQNSAMIAELQNVHEDMERRQIIKCKQTDALIDLACELYRLSKVCDDEGDLNCGTGSDVPYACAQVYREIAGKIERIAFIP